MCLARGCLWSYVLLILYNIYFVLFAVWYRTEPIKLDMFQKGWFSSKSERKWSLVRTIIRILWGRSARSLESLHHSVAISPVMLWWLRWIYQMLTGPHGQHCPCPDICVKRPLGWETARLIPKWFLPAALCC